MSYKIVTVFLVAVTAGPNTVKATPADGDIFSPHTYSVDFPTSCLDDDRPYCFDKGDNYPDEKIKELLKDMRKLKVGTPAPAPPSYGARYGNYDEPDCPTISTDQPIYYILDVNGKNRVVVQSPEKFQQIYTVKSCVKEGRIMNSPHFLKDDILDKYKVECVNTKMSINFFVLSDDMTKMELATVKDGIPVCCRCRYKK